MPRKRRILIVDDEAGMLALLRTLLKKEKFEVLESRTADSALEMLEHETVDLIISDIMMPGMNGIEFLNEVREWDMDLPVIFVSGKKSGQKWADAVRSDASSLVEKPVKKEVLLKAVHRALAGGRDGAPDSREDQSADFLENLI